MSKQRIQFREGWLAESTSSPDLSADICSVAQRRSWGWHLTNTRAHIFSRNVSKMMRIWFCTANLRAMSHNFNCFRQIIICSWTSYVPEVHALVFAWKYSKLIRSLLENSQEVYIFTTCLGIKFQMLSFNNSLFIALSPTAKIEIGEASILIFYIPRKYYPNKRDKVFENL
jgi:hypothetical protein